MKTLQEVKEYIAEMGYEDVIVFDEPSYASAFIGISSDERAVYDYNKMIDFLVENNEMDEEEAADFISYNSSFSQPNHPIILYPVIGEE